MNVHKLLVVPFILFFISGNLLFGQGNLILMQKRLVFSGNNINEDMQIVDFGNIGNEAAEYEVSLINLRMTEQGGFETIIVPDSGQFFADNNIRFYPRLIVIAPNGSQTMKVQMYDAETLAPGEYRSHLYIRARNGSRGGASKDISGSSSDVGSESSSDAGSGKDVSISIRTEFGIAIPVIIRKGESTTVVNLSNLKLVRKEGETPQLQFTIERSGNFSSYGHINVTHVSADGIETPAGGVMGVAVYTPTAARHCSLNLDISDKAELSGVTQDSGGIQNSGGTQLSGGTHISAGALRVEYVQPKEEGGAVIAKSEIQF